MEPIEIIPYNQYYKNKKKHKPGQKREKSPEQMANIVDADGSVRNFRYLSEQLVPKKNAAIAKGAEVAMTGGQHNGLWGCGRSFIVSSFRIVTFMHAHEVMVKLHLNGEVLK